MPVICLVRHGQASFGAQDYDVLSEIGREQAAVVGAELARRGLRDPLVVCGTLNRQRDTAHLLMSTSGFGGQPQQDPRWNEFDHIGLVKRYTDPASNGHADSRSFQQQLDRSLRAWIEGTQDADQNGWAAFASGATAALTELPAVLGQGRDAVVVTSGGVLAAICGALLSVRPAGVVALNRVMVNAAITTIVVGASGTSLLTVNDHAHFAGERRELLTYR